MAKLDVWTASDYAWVAERAEEELRILELQHPDRFGSLKLELATLLFEARSFLLSGPYGSAKAPSSSPSSSVSACTAASSNMIRKRKCIEEGERRACRIESNVSKREEHVEGCGVVERMDGADVAIEKAKACLRRIREVKQVIRPSNLHDKLESL